jgi:hypothetical protein
MPETPGYPLLSWQLGSGASVLSIEDFETRDFTSLPWEHSGNRPWSITFGESHSGTYCAQAGAIDDDETSTLKLTFLCASGDISFHVKVSSEWYFDRLVFVVDGQEIEEWSGEVEWREVFFPVTAGSHTFEWSYVKDDSSGQGDDTAWLDDIVLPSQQ